jgi:hypothetical protein
MATLAAAARLIAGWTPMTYRLPYFGYGTLLGGNMRERYPSATALGLATYQGHELDFLRYDSADKGGCSPSPTGIMER